MPASLGFAWWAFYRDTVFDCSKGPFYTGKPHPERCWLCAAYTDFSLKLRYHYSKETP